jgi:hypothetical protein
MKKFALAGLFGLAQLSALGGCGEIGLSVDYLYWGQANLFVDGGQAFRDEGALVSDKRIDPTYSSGVRGELRWLSPWSCVALSGRYYYVEPSQSQPFLNVVGDFEAGTSITTLSAQIPYHAGDILLSYPVSLCSCLQLNLLAGGHVLYWALNVQERVEYPEGFGEGGLSFLLEQQVHSRLAGGGAVVGFGSIWDVWCGLQAFAEVQYGVIRGSYMQAGWLEQEPETLSPVPPSRIETLPRSGQVWTRELDLRLGARYGCQLGCFGVAIEAGWENRSYLDLNVPILSYRSSSELQCFGRDMGGPFVGLTGSF